MAGNKTGIGNGGKSDGDDNKVGGQATASTAMARATVTRLAGNKEGKDEGGKGDGDGDEGGG